MSKIRLLSEHVANQIAAGEVIERPASVVKEFLENAIDAQARNVTVQVDGDGTRLIRIVDDGEGMDQDDVLLCLERHATSKLNEARPGGQQLSGISTLGFRGEAVPSIASVARLVIISRPGTAQLGTRVEVRYGKVVKVHETGAGQGTVMEMRDLFGNVPARKKFLKSRRTELSHIDEVVRNCCLAAPGLGITYEVNGVKAFSLPAATDTLESRARWLLGRQPTSSLVQVDSSEGLEGESSGAGFDFMRVNGFLLPPDEAPGPAARLLRVFVNNRAVRDRVIVHAVSEGLAGFLMKGRMAAGVLCLSLPPEALDVNVHPTKLEVRYQAPHRVHRLVALAVRRAVEKYQEGLKYSLFGLPSSRSREALVVSAASGTSGPIRPTGIAAETPWRPTSDISPGERTPQQLVDFPGARCQAGEEVSAYDAARRPEPVREDSRPAERAAGMPSRTEPARAAPLFGSIDSLVPIGQLMDLYIICESCGPQGSGLVVIDQHAVHERLLFESLKKQFADARVASQNLLFPVLIELTRQQVQVLQKYRQEVERLGIDLEEFGEQSYAIKAVPAPLAHLAAEEIMTAVLDQFGATPWRGGGGAGDNGGRSAEARIDDVLAAMACKAAVKAGRPLAAEEIAALLTRIREAEVFSHCPHGRPVLKTFTAAEIKKWFHRT